MTLEEKIGQLFVFGFKDQAYSSSLDSFLNDYKPGGLIFFSRNGKSPQTVIKLIQGVKNHYKSQPHLEPLFIVDHEGGDVVRVGPSHFFPSALSLGQTKDQAIAFDLGKWTGRYLKNMGFDINLAPVVDLRSEKKLNFIGERSFSSSPEEVVKIVNPFIGGTRSAGVISVLKHFPGHGRLEEDSHKEIVRKISSEDELRKKDLLPFKKLIKAHPNIGVMTSHLSVPALDKTGELTTFSKPIVSKLKDEYQHSGMVFSDDLDMLYFKNKSINIGQKAVDALKAGHDQVLIVWSKRNQKNALRELKKAVNDGRLSESFVNEKVKKILSTKMRIKDNKILKYENVKKSLAKIYNLQNQITFLHFNKLPKSLFQEISETSKSKKNAYLFSHSYSFFKGFRDNFTKGGFIPLNQSTWLSSIKTCKKNLCFFHVSGDSSVKKLNQIPKDVLEHLVIVNTTDPNATDSFPSKKINLYGKNNKFWKWFANELDKLKADYAFL